MASTAVSYSVLTSKPHFRNEISRISFFLNHLISLDFLRDIAYKWATFALSRHLTILYALVVQSELLIASLNKPKINVFNIRLILWNTVFCSEKLTWITSVLETRGPEIASPSKVWSKSKIQSSIQRELLVLMEVRKWWWNGGYRCKDGGRVAVHSSMVSWKR